MAFDRFIIAPINSGLTTDQKPYLIPDDAFASLNNAYCWRGMIRKRFGSRLIAETSNFLTNQLQSRFRVSLGPTVAGILAGFVPGHIFKVGQMFSVGPDLFTVISAIPGPQPMLSTNPFAVGTFDVTNGAFAINDPTQLAVTVFFYPAEPVMGLTNYETGPINDQQSFGFDTEFAYHYIVGAGWGRSGTPIWHGNNLNFFWAENWDGLVPNNVLLFVTNFQANTFQANLAVPVANGLVTDDPIWYMFPADIWTPFSYSPDAVLNPANLQPKTVTTTSPGANTIITNYVQTARLIVAFKNRLLLLNTIENGGSIPAATPITPANYLTSINTPYPNRCRYSHNGSPLAANAWLEPNQTYNPGAGTVIADGAGFIDAPTEEQIISAQFIKDRLIVFFERSTWELVYTSNEILPFVWQKINTELGTESQFSTVPFDKVILTIANVGVHACNGANVERIDNKIPDQIFQILNKNSDTGRVAGVRDYFAEMVYWAIPTVTNATAVYPNKVLVYNYRNGAWSFNDDCITAFGYFEQATDITWNSTTLQWQQFNSPWNSGFLEAQSREIIAGNQQGFTFIIDVDESRNAPAMQLTNVTWNGISTLTLTIIDHTLNQGDFIKIENAQGIVWNTPAPFNADIVLVSAVINKDTVTAITVQAFVGVYTGGGTVTRVSQINIKSKQFNPYIDKARNVFVQKIDFNTQKTGLGEISVDYFASDSSLTMAQEGTATGSILGTSVLETFSYGGLETFATSTWHPVYFQSDGEFIQLFIYWTAFEMFTPNVSLEDFKLFGLVLICQPTVSRLQP